VSQAYADVNQMFGNIVKVTPSSKVVGDMAMLMVSSGITKEQVLDPNFEVAFPESVVQMMRGDLGRPEGGWPEASRRRCSRAEAARHASRRPWRRSTSSPSARSSTRS
jgi:pyruvate carboxylase